MRRCKFNGTSLIQYNNVRQENLPGKQLRRRYFLRREAFSANKKRQRAWALPVGYHEFYEFIISRM